MTEGIKVFLSAPQEPDKRITALRAALAAWGVDAFYEQRGKDAGMQLSQRVQQAIVDCTLFLRVCTEATPRSFWMSLEAGTFLGVQSEDHRQGSPQRRKQVNLILSYDYAQEPFDRAGILVDATTQTTLEWVNALRDALGLAPLASVDGLNLDLPARSRTIPRRTLVTVGVAAGALVVGGAAAGVIVNQLNRGPIVISLPTVTPTARPRANKKWAFATGGSVNASVAVADGVIYAGSWDGNLYAIDAATGTKRWAFPAGGDAKYEIHKDPTVANGVVYTQAANPVAETGSPFYALHTADGSKVWSLSAGAVLDSRSESLVANGVLYVPSYNGGLVGAFDPATGNELAAAEALITFDLGFSGVALAGNLLYGGTQQGEVYALDVTNRLAVRWTHTLGTISQSTEVSATPAVANGVVYVGCQDANLYALDASSGNVLWQYATGDAITFSSPMVANGVVYVGSEDYSLHAVDAATGKAKWKYPTKGRVQSSPLVLNGIVYFGSRDSTVYALDAATGTLQRKYETGGDVFGSPRIVDGVLYIGSYDHYVYAFVL